MNSDFYGDALSTYFIMYGVMHLPWWGFVIVIAFFLFTVQPIDTNMGRYYEERQDSGVGESSRERRGR